METYYGRLKTLLARVALFAAAIAMSATLLLAVAGAFYSVSSEPVLADSPEGGPTSPAAIRAATAPRGSTG